MHPYYIDTLKLMLLQRCLSVWNGIFVNLYLGGNPIKLITLFPASKVFYSIQLKEFHFINLDANNREMFRIF